MTAKRTCRLGLILLGAGIGTATRATAEEKKLEPVKSWVGILEDKRLTELAPAKGYVTSEAVLKKLWEAWRPDEKLPKVDFTKQIVLVNLGGMYPVDHELHLTDQGDLKVQLSARVPGKRGYGYGIAVIERTGVKTIKGKAIEPDERRVP